VGCRAVDRLRFHAAEYLMTDQSQSSGSTTPQHIDADDDEQARRWAERFGVTTEELKDAVRAVGDEAEEVEDYLKGGGRRTA
jgi:hypothetical protein